VFTVAFSGDIGRYDTPIIKDPTSDFAEEDRDIDLLIMESTYGDRLHAPIVDMAPMLKQVIEDTLERGGTLLVPAFAFGRTQQLLYFLHELYDAGEVPRLPVYVDSPLATRLTKVYGEHPEVYDQETHETFLSNGKNPFTFKQIHFVQSVEESMALNRDENPKIVISASAYSIICATKYTIRKIRFWWWGSWQPTPWGDEFSTWGWPGKKKGAKAMPRSLNFTTRSIR